MTKNLRQKVIILRRIAVLYRRTFCYILICRTIPTTCRTIPTNTPCRTIPTIACKTIPTPCRTIPTIGLRGHFVGRFLHRVGGFLQSTPRDRLAGYNSTNQSNLSTNLDMLDYTSRLQLKFDLCKYYTTYSTKIHLSFDESPM